MAILHVKLLNPKAIGLLRTLHQMELISIKGKEHTAFISVAKKLRKKKANITTDEIAHEVQEVRTKRYSKRKV